MSDLAHLAGVIRMFAPGEDVEAIKPIRPHSNRKGGAGRPWTVAALDIMRTANGPLTARAIARRIVVAQGITDLRTLWSIECSLSSTLPKRAGVVMADGRPKRWAIGA
jgi:hypothetical protein